VGQSTESRLRLGSTSGQKMRHSRAPQTPSFGISSALTVECLTHCAECQRWLTPVCITVAPTRPWSSVCRRGLTRLATPTRHPCRLVLGLTTNVPTGNSPTSIVLRDAYIAGHGLECTHHHARTPRGGAVAPNQCQATATVPTRPVHYGSLRMSTYVPFRTCWR
jgi:hypothetical protein